MEKFPLSSDIEVSLRMAELLTGKTIKTMQRWCDENKLPSRVVDLRGKRVVALRALLRFTPLRVDDSDLVAEAERGSADAHNEIALIFLAAGKHAIACRCFEEAARLGHADAMHWLATSHISGKFGVAENQAEGLKWLAAAAAQKHPIAMVQMQALCGDQKATNLK